MDNYKGIKIYVPTPETSEKVQKRLFDIGLDFPGHKKQTVRSEAVFLYVDDSGNISHGGSENVFNNRAEKEILYQAILDPHYDVKLAWVNGKTVQRKIDTDDGLRWVDWHDSSSLDIECGYDWRIKPNNITVHQWERKYYDSVHELVWTLPYREENYFSIPSSWVPIGEPYMIEHTYSLE